MLRASKAPGTKAGAHAKGARAATKNKKVSQRKLKKFSTKVADADHSPHHKYQHASDVSEVKSFEDYPIGSGTPHDLRHNGPSPADMATMLKVIGVENVEQLMKETIPQDILTVKKLAAGAGASEHEALSALRTIMKQNKIYTTHIGKGYYNTHTPNVILRNIVENPAWYTPYTPYQAEISQGRLEMLLNYQTMCGDLTGLPIASASLLDEATAASEALMMLWGRSKHSTILIDKNTHVQTIDVIQTRARGFGWTVKLVDVSNMEAEATEDVFAVLISYPGSDGDVDHIPEVCKNIKSKTKAKLAVATDLMSLAMLTPPGEFGADVCIGSSQRFGVPMGYGGPHAAFLTTSNEYARKIPGRIIGVSRDAEGKPALRMAMQSREQHIRRERASSNICTAQALLANVAAAYAVHHGAPGIKHIAQSIHATAVTASKQLHKLHAEGVHVNTKHFFDTFAVTFKSKQQLHEVLTALDQAEINVHVENDTTVHISFDEVSSTPAHINSLVAAVAKGVRSTQQLTVDHVDVTESLIPDGLKRVTQYLTHPVFNSHRSETAMLRYLYQLQQKDLSLATAMIPLGSCTMKLNATAEMIPITWPEVNGLHPFADPSQTKGYQKLFDDLAEWLCNATGFDAMCLQPNSGAQGEYAGLQTILAYHKARGEGHRNLCLIPASAHGTNPASAAMAGLGVVVVNCDVDGNIDVADLRAKAVKHKDNLAAIQITYPSTHGVFETSVREVCDIVHENGGQVYMDGANMNSQVGWLSPGDIGADVCHLNLHKTFTIPHGGGGPGMGPIGVRKHLADFLPRHSYHAQKHKIYKLANINTEQFKPHVGSPPAHAPHFEQEHSIEGTLVPVQRGHTTGAVSAAPFGSSSILPIPWMYIKMLGGDGLRVATQTAILNANYLMARLQNHYPILFTGENGRCAHEFIIDIRDIKKRTGISEEDVAKRLMDAGFHAPTMSFPVTGTLMVEPTESEPLSELDRFVDAMVQIRKEIDDVETGVLDRENNPLKHSPHTAEVVLSDSWNRPYSREQAAYPIKSSRKNKFWPTVSRLDGTYGDRNLVCSCPPIESYTM